MESFIVWYEELIERLKQDYSESAAEIDEDEAKKYFFDKGYSVKDVATEIYKEHSK